MRSIAFAVVIFAGILACTSAAPQLSRFDLGWLEGILREAGQRNSTVRFGNNTIIISGVSNAVASTNDGVIRPTPPSDQWNNQGWNPWNNYRYPYYNGGYWRTSPNVNGESVEEPLSSSEEFQEVADDISDEPSEEDVYQEDQTAENEEDEEIDEADHELDDESEDATIEEAEEIEDEEIYPEEEAVEAELETIEKELADKETN